MRHQEYGFTLFEFLITFMIIAILVTITLPDLKLFYTNTDKTILQSQLMMAINLAIKETNTQQQSIGLCPSKDHQNCSDHWQNDLLIFIDSNQNGTILNRAQIITVIPKLSTVGQLHWRAYPHYRHYLLFNLNPILETDNGSFWYCETKQKKPLWALILNKSGRIRFTDQPVELKKLTCT